MFKDRNHAGQMLADRLAAGRYGEDVRLLAVPRGGVVVAAPIARRLNCSLGLLITRKIGHPLNPEVAVGAVMPDGSAVWDQSLLDRSGIDQTELSPVLREEYAEIKRRLLTYTGSDKPPAVKNRSVILIDDGIATGYTARAAVQWLKKLSPVEITIAVPVAPPDVVKLLAKEVNAVICPVQPELFRAVGMYYEDFSQTPDEAVLAILSEVNRNKA
ncbi:Hypothetical protein LUCI_0199 [Lucifera butyrica]|uniref:Phosphoribosyltransferase domain-containing protein n=1 Tax=Lucifera butyrica TaxID=1351585 RepID=A0A498R491_9FIRM|nr:phosphoribosyltransferase family protein [Lucifera butyrica]VBB04993.1 Hypothetical protein LUCI_0199 [Lucifera butyrica]